MAEKPEVAAEPVFDKKWLEGLKFKTSEPREVKGEDGRPGKQHIPKERALRQEDILSWKDNGNSVVLVTADGQKYTVSKAKGKGGE